MKSFPSALRTLLPLVDLPRWAVPTLIGLGLFAALAEGLSISLIIPLIQGFSNSGVSGIGAWLLLPFERVPEAWRLPAIGGAILGCVVLKNLLSYAYAVLFSWLNASLGHQLRCGVLRQLLSVSQSYLDTQDMGKLMNTLGNDTWRASSAFGTLATLLINACLVVIFSLLLLFISWKLTLVTALALFFISRVIRIMTRRARRLGDEAVKANQNASQRMVEVFAGMRLIRAYGREPYEQRRYERASRGIRRAFFRMDLMSASVGPTSEILATLLLISLLLFSIRNPAGVATSVTFLLLLYRLHPRVRQIESDRVTLRTLTPSLVELSAVMANDNKTYLDTGSRRLTRLASGIELDAVTLRYASTERDALAETSLTIPAGRTTALVGPSGAGKSSVISLLCRFYDPTSGEIRVDGLPLRELDLAWWREQIALVSQDIHVFNTTVAANIAYGKLEATEAEVVEAARRANALAFIKTLPQGFDTVLGDRGFRLSGGQRQRLALARALVRDPQILILDEATNALDSISERLVQDALESFGRDRTVIIIAHRLSTIEHADHVVVLEAGRVVEHGTPRALLAAGGLFAELHTLQSGGFHAPAAR